MPQWLEIYLAFALAGGLVTYKTVIRAVVAEMAEITDEQSSWADRPVAYFFIWLAINLVMAPFLFFIIIKGDLPELKQNMLIRWLESAGHND